MTAGRSPVRTAAAELVAASFVVLFQELAVIRWAGVQVRALAYFPNLILLSAFLGLGLGSLRAKGRSLLWAWPPSLVALVAAIVALSRVVFTQSSTAEHLWLLYYDLDRNAPVVNDVRLPIVAVFVLSAACFVPLGQFVAARLDLFRERSSAIWGYAWDVVGSSLGVVAFAVASFWGTFPVVWFAVLLVAGVALVLLPRRLLIGYAACAVLVLLAVAGGERADAYSPYYSLRAEGAPEGSRFTGGGFLLLANGSLHQVAFGVRDIDPETIPGEPLVRSGYRIPYRALGRAPGAVLVLGAGTGNDVAVALDSGAERVDAVEIDPKILDIGRERHPNRPYASPRVRVFNTDARSYLNGTADRYDLIVFATLDSMTRLSALSSVRLDNFVYTQESLAAARERLNPGGGVAMYFAVNTPYIDARLHSLHERVFGRPPAVVRDHHKLFNRILLSGPAFDHLERAGAEGRANDAGTEIPTDDWPYLYLARRAVSGFYWSLIGIFAALAVAGVAVASRGPGRGILGVGSFDAPMFLFGLAFLLLESRAVTDMNLVWGATWLTSGVVFGSILATILLATLATGIRPLPLRVAATGLFGTLVLSWLLPVRHLLTLEVPLRLVLSALFVGGPVFFAASSFAVLFGKHPRAADAFGWNVLGAVAGGLLEFLGMVIGLRALALVALGAYACAFLFQKVGSESTREGGKEAGYHK